MTSLKKMIKEMYIGYTYIRVKKAITEQAKRIGGQRIKVHYYMSDHALQRMEERNFGQQEIVHMLSDALPDVLDAVITTKFVPRFHSKKEAIALIYPENNFIICNVTTDFENTKEIVIFVVTLGRKQDSPEVFSRKGDYRIEVKEKSSV